MTAKEEQAKELLRKIAHYETSNNEIIVVPNINISVKDYDNLFTILTSGVRALEELEAIKSADGNEAIEQLNIIREYYDEDGEDEATSDSWKIIENYILKAQAQEQELRELKATIKELLDIPITVSTFNGTSLLVKTMNKLNKLVGDKDE